MPAPAAYKESPSQFKETDGWKVARPSDAMLRGKWWEMFHQPELNALEEQVTVTNNQTLAAALQNFFIARDIMKETRSGLFPTVSADPGATESRSNLRTPTSSLGFGSVMNTTSCRFIATR